MTWSKHQRCGEKGFTLIELLIVVAIIGIIAAILIPNLVDALQKAKQKSSVADMRSLGTAWMSWVTDQVAAGSAGLAVQQLDWEADLPIVVTSEALAAILEGDGDHFYLHRMPTNDGWQHPYEFKAAFTAGDDSSYSVLMTGSRMIGIRSPGRSGDFDGTTYTSGAFLSSKYDCDIVWSDGYFVRVPGVPSSAESGSKSKKSKKQSEEEC